MKTFRFVCIISVLIYAMGALQSVVFIRQFIDTSPECNIIWCHELSIVVQDFFIFFLPVIAFWVSRRICLLITKRPFLVLAVESILIAALWFWINNTLFFYYEARWSTYLPAEQLATVLGMMNWLLFLIGLAVVLFAQYTLDKRLFVGKS